MHENKLERQNYLIIIIIIIIKRTLLCIINYYHSTDKNDKFVYDYIIL